MTTPATPEKILQTGLAFWPAKTLLSAIEIGVFTELAHGPEPFEALRRRLGLHPRSARDFLDTLVALGFLQREGERYRNTPDTDLFLDRKKPTYLGGFLEMANQRLYPFWGHLTEALRTGLPQNEVKSGAPGLFEGLYADPSRLKLFLAAMTGLSRGANLAIARQFPWRDYSSFVDVGTAQGDLAVQIALANPHLQGAGFDLAEVGRIFEEYVEAAGLSARLRFVSGSFFDDELPEDGRRHHGAHPARLGPADEEDADREGVRRPPHGRRAHRLRVDHRRRPIEERVRLMMSLNMLIETPGGFDYTGADCAGWMKEAGFSSTRVEHLVGPDSMVIGIK